MQDVQHRADQVKEILQSPNLYHDDGGSLEILEGFVQDQVDHPQLYNLDANLAILKLYLIYPKYSKVSITRNILTKALMRLPATDFDLCLCQTPLPLQQNDPTIRALIAAEGRLQTCRFSEFWHFLDTEPELVAISSIADMKNSIRRFMAGVIALTYHTITIADLSQLLGLPSSELQQFCQHHLTGQWVFDDKAGVVTITKSSESVTHGTTKQPTQALLSPETLCDCLAPLKRMQHDLPVYVDESATFHT